MNYRKLFLGSITSPLALLRLALLCALPGILLSCRVPDPPVFKDKSRGLIYDTALESEIRSGMAPTIVTTAFARYVDTLSEPVAVTAWSDTDCRWTIFVATNRGIFHNDETSTETENRVLETVAYGQSDVRLAKQERGKEPKLESKRGPKWIPAWGRGGADSDKNNATATSNSLSQDQFLDGVNDQLKRSRQNDLLIFVHGFNVGFDAAVIRTAQLAMDMPFNGAVVAYCWPTQGGVFSYSGDESINKASVGPFCEFLRTIREGVSPETRINIVVHSMGNRIVMESLARLASDSVSASLSRQSKKPFANLALCAPDVGRSDFQTWAPGVVSMCERVTLYASSSDSALIASKGLHAELRAGDAWDPLIAEDVETIDCSRIDLSFMGHSYYGSNTDVLSDLFMLLKENLPASKRPHLHRLESDTGSFYFQFAESAPAIHCAWHFEEIAPQ